MPSVWLMHIALVITLDEGGVACLLDPLGDAVHGPVQRTSPPSESLYGRAIEHLRLTVRVVDKLEGIRALGTECALVDRAARITLDVDDLRHP